MRPGRRALAAALVWTAAAGLAPAARAQLPHLDPLPWYTPADSSSQLALVAEVDRFTDKATDWAVNRVMVTATLPAGTRSVWFLRLPYLSFDTSGQSVPARWPGTVGKDQPEGWPGGERLTGFGQLEVGAAGPLGLRGLGPWRYGFALGLPTGQNALYPWSSTSLPLRLQLQGDLRPSGPWHLWLGGGYLLHLDASGNTLAPEAFPNGWQAMAELGLLRGPGSSWRLTASWEDRNTRRSLLVGAAVWLPWTGDASIGLRAARELADAADRPARWYLALSWRFDSPSHRPGAADRGGPAPGAGGPRPPFGGE